MLQLDIQNQYDTIRQKLQKTSTSCNLTFKTNMIQYAKGTTYRVYCCNLTFKTNMIQCVEVFEMGVFCCNLTFKTNMIQYGDHRYKQELVAT